MVEQLASGNFQELIQLHDPVAHCHRLAPQRLQLGIFDVEIHNAVEHMQLVLRQIIFGDRRIFFSHEATGPRGMQPHQRLGRIRPLRDHFGGGVSVCGPMHLVLDGGEEFLRRLGVRGVVHARRVDIEHLLVKTPFRRPDVADALQQFVEIILLAFAWRILEPLVVHGETLHQKLIQAPDGPLPELRAPMAAHAETDGENGRREYYAFHVRYPFNCTASLAVDDRRSCFC